MKVIVAVEGQGYEADTNSINVFYTLHTALFANKKEYLDIDIRTTSNIIEDHTRLMKYQTKLSKNGKLMFEREGGFWLEITEKEIVC